ncbi:unnamed protein product [Pleuronectes platessa]|uniref:Uncharacterized protein n=1 Tax=Pleuronectes platessa TaxID=8262 RepID=A0A9N7VGX4_PLEPL|nr:unnamed protein product [Pleuronectes platessa]
MAAAAVASSGSAPERSSHTKAGNKLMCPANCATVAAGCSAALPNPPLPRARRCAPGGRSEITCKQTSRHRSLHPNTSHLLLTPLGADPHPQRKLEALGDTSRPPGGIPRSSSSIPDA